MIVCHLYAEFQRRRVSWKRGEYVSEERRVSRKRGECPGGESLRGERRESERSLKEEGFDKIAVLRFLSQKQKWNRKSGDCECDRV